MPRRTHDYASAYTAFNVIATTGSTASVVATVVFLYAVYSMFNCNVSQLVRSGTVVSLGQSSIEIRGAELNFINLSDIHVWAHRKVQTLAHSWQTLFQQPATMTAENIIILHDEIMIIMIFIVAAVFVLLHQATVDTTTWLEFRHHHKLEIIWTFVPALILVVIALPSFAMLFASEQLAGTVDTIRIDGHQWY